MRILVVDDEETMREVLQVFLIRAGWEVALAGNDDDALKQYRKHGPFDVVLTDIMHPGVGGLELCEIIRKRNAKQAIVVLTAAASKECARQFEHLNIPVAPKPIDRQDLIDLISQSVKR